MSTTEELWQAYDDQGRAIAGKGLTKDEARRGILHGASHVWIWRVRAGEIEILLQKRATDKATWPGYYDISAAGHIDLGEDPLIAAIRETKEEIGVDISPEELKFIGVERRSIPAIGTDIIENEVVWLYILELEQQDYTVDTEEVESVEWAALTEIRQAVLEGAGSKKYVPQGDTYFRTLFEAIESEAEIQR